MRYNDNADDDDFDDDSDVDVEGDRKQNNSCLIELPTQFRLRKNNAVTT